MNTPKVGRTKAAKQRIKRAVLVYQAGIANVFAVDCFNMADYGRNARRLIQSDFRACEHFALGLVAAGISVATMVCNQSGDIINAQWTTELESAPFSEQFRPVMQYVTN